jgi:hypothetical protein
MNKPKENQEKILQSCEELLKWYHSKFYGHDGNEYFEKDILHELSAKDLEDLGSRFTALQNTIYDWHKILQEIDETPKKEPKYLCPYCNIEQPVYVDDFGWERCFGCDAM